MVYYPRSLTQSITDAARQQMIIPPNSLQAETLIAILENYITREGTDYGERELDLQSKTKALKQQVLAGEVLIVFDSLSDSINLMTRDEHKYWQATLSE